MTEYEINKRLAEIAGLWEDKQPLLNGVVQGRGWSQYVTHHCVYPHHKSGRLLEHESCLSREWSPLTDWSQLGPLMERAAWEISYLKAREWDKREARWEVRCTLLRDESAYSAVYEACDASQQKAICLAIIAAHEE